MLQKDIFNLRTLWEHLEQEWVSIATIHNYKFLDTITKCNRPILVAQLTIIGPILIIESACGSSAYKRRVDQMRTFMSSFQTPLTY